MGNFFGSIYCAFEKLFGRDLSNYLWGYTSENEVNHYIGYGLWMLGISLAVVLLYYYVINHPRLCNWWGWLIFLVVNAGINLWMGWQMLLQDYFDELMVTVDPATNETIALDVTEANIFGFGFSHMLISIGAFLIFTFSLKWWSTNCSHAPF